jgi:hypothetical protein
MWKASVSPVEQLGLALHSNSAWAEAGIIRAAKNRASSVFFIHAPSETTNLFNIGMAG